MSYQVCGQHDSTENVRHGVTAGAFHEGRGGKQKGAQTRQRRYY